MKVTVIGGLGKMGGHIVQELKANNIEVQIIDKSNHTDTNAIDKDVNAVIDISHHSASVSVAKTCADKGLSLLIACTGHTRQEIEEINKFQAKIPIEFCANLSLGISFIMKGLDNLTMLGNHEVSIYECHHKYKKDSPSGTALLLRNKIKQTTDIDCEIVSSRIGDEFGTHIITLSLEHETITIMHQAKSRKAFSTGAVKKLIKLAELSVSTK